MKIGKNSKLLALVLCVMMLMTTVQMVAAAVNFEMKVDDVTVQEGTTDVITVPVRITSIASDLGILCLGVNFTFDPTKLVFQTSTLPADFAGSMIKNPTADTILGASAALNGSQGVLKYDFFTDNMTYLLDKTKVDESNIYINLKFKLADGLAPGTYPINIVPTSEVLDGSFNEVISEAEMSSHVLAGSITVEGEEEEDIFGMKVDEVEVVAGSTDVITVPVRITSIASDLGILCLGVNFTFDPTKLVFQTSTNPADFAGSMIKNPTADTILGASAALNGSQGVLKYDFFTDNMTYLLDKTKVDADNVYIYLKFKLAAGVTAGTYPINIVPTSEMLDGNFEEVISEAAMSDYVAAGAVVVTGASTPVITAITPVAPKTVAYGTAWANVGLPATVSATLDGVTPTTLNVAWAQGSYDGSVSDTYTVTGTVDPGTYEAGVSLSITTTVTVQEDPSTIKAELPTLTDKAPGTDVQVPVTFKNLPVGTKSFDFGLTFDSNKLTYKSFIKGTGYGSDPEVNSATAGKLGVAGLTTDAGVGGDQVVITLVFTINAAAQDGLTALALSNVKYGNSSNANTSIPAGSLVNGSIDIKTPIDPLDAAKQQAKSALEIALAGYNQADYSTANWTALNNAKTAGDTAIDNATTIPQVETERDNAIAAMDAVKTLAEELADAKVAAKADLATALAGYNQADYSTANWTALNNAKTAGDTAIDAAGTIAAVDTAKADALAAMDAVKTIAEELDDAKDAAKADLATALAGYNQADYSAANWTALNNAKTAGDDAIDAAGTIAAVDTAKADALAAMDAVKTIAEEDAERIAAAIAKVNTGVFTLQDLKDTAATGIIDANFNSYKVAMPFQKEINDDEDLEIADINSVIAIANGVTPAMRGDVIFGVDEDGIYANDAAAVRDLIIRTGKPAITLAQIIRADYDNDGIVNVIDIINILIEAAENNVPE